MELLDLVKVFLYILLRLMLMMFILSMMSPTFSVTVPFVEYWIILASPLYEVPYFYIAPFIIMNFYDLVGCFCLLYFCCSEHRHTYVVINSFDVLISIPQIVLSEESCPVQLPVGMEYNP